MIPGISSNSGYPVSNFVTRVQPSRVAPQQQQAATEEVQSESTAPELTPPSGDEATLVREYNLLDLANRQYSRILPQIEAVTAEVA